MQGTQYEDLDPIYMSDNTLGNEFDHVIQNEMNSRMKKVRDEVSSVIKNSTSSTLIRGFKTGATRNSDYGKLDYEGFLSPIVLERYAQYLDKHRKQADGQMRSSDNWQKGIPKSVYASSLLRHTIDVWMKHRAFPGDSEYTLEDSICAVIFNSMGYLFELLKSKYGDTKLEPTTMGWDE